MITFLISRLFWAKEDLLCSPRVETKLKRTPMANALSRVQALSESSGSVFRGQCSMETSERSK